MENEFTDQMKKKSTNELIEVTDNKEDWQPEAVKAAESEINKRKELIGNNKIEVEDEDNFEFEILEKIKKSSDSELVELYKNSFKDYSKIELNFLTEELIKRKVEPTVWYYAKGNNKNGPHSSSEMKEFAEKMEIDFYDYVWREGLNNWTEAKNVDGLFNENISIPPRIGNQKPDWITSTEKREKPVSIIIAAIILFTTIPLWIFVAFFQAGVSVISSDTGLGLIAIWNILMTFALLAIGIGIIKLKKWGYSWGIGTAVLNLFWFGYNFLNTGVLFLLFLTLIELIIAILLYMNRNIFQEQKGNLEKIYI